MSTLRLVLGDQLSHTIAALRDVDKKNDTIMLCEVMAEASYVPHHPKKIAFLFAAMRHFAGELRDAGHRVRYVMLDDPDNTGSFDGEMKRAVAELKPAHLVLTEPGEWRVLQMMRDWQAHFKIPVRILGDDRFLCSLSQFKEWASNKKQLRMEFFYREMRKRYHLLMEIDGTPVGSKWNYDKDNRKAAVKGMKFPKRISHKKSGITRDVLKLVSAHFSKNFGQLEPFHYAVTRGQALLELEDFIHNSLPQFGDFQDAMVAGEPYLFHSLLSTYLNAGLLLPLEICRSAEQAYLEGRAPLNAVEGFIRQILGWREFVRGIYWHHMPDYGAYNFFAADTPLPDFYWGAHTEMFCLKETVAHTFEHAHSHHIQRLMVTGNFALLAGLDVLAVQEWYLSVYSDAYEWVEMPNTLGMALFGDGGIMGSKPYAASGKYIHRMSNYCKSCSYDPNQMLGENACPFNALYWDFLARNDKKLRGNPRIPYVFVTWDRFGEEKQTAIRNQAAASLQRMKNGSL